MSTSANFVGGYACKLVNKPPIELQTECSICLQLLRDPEMVNCCGYKFCKSCISPILRRRKPCPLCGERNITTMADRQLQRTLNGLQVHCLYAESGCDWEGKLGALERHLNRDYTQENWLEGCGFVSVECLACGGQCLRKGGQEHVQDECPEAQVLCKFNHIGCQEILPRKHMQSHAKSKMSSHMTLLLDHTQKLAEEYNNKSNEIVNTIDNLQALGGDSVLSGDVSMTRKKLQRARGRHRRTGTPAAVWGVGGFIVAALLAVLLAVSTTESPLHGRGGHSAGDEIANLKQSLQDLDQKLEAMSRDSNEAKKLRAELETTMESMKTERTRQQELRDELMKTVADNAKVRNDMLRLERLLKEDDDPENSQEGTQERRKDYSTDMKAKLDNLAGALRELTELKTAVSSLSSKSDVDGLKLEVEGIRDELVATKQQIETLPGLPSFLLEVQRLIREELDKHPLPPHGRHSRHRHGCHH